MKLVNIETIPQLPWLFCHNCNHWQAVARGHFTENEVDIKLVLCKPCLDEAVAGQLEPK
jgi:hypothetical protein